MSENLKHAIDWLVRPGEILLEVAGPDPMATSYILVAALTSLIFWAAAFLIFRRFIVGLFGGHV